MAIPDSTTLLEQWGIRPSPARVLIARELMRSEGLMTSQQIEERLQTVDRSSISRALSLFADRGLVHAIDDGTGSVKYELCRSSRHDHCHHDPDTDQHPHFHCVECGRTVCLESIAIPSIPLPEGYEARGVNYVVKGICSRCSAKR